ncbi:MAG: hypothetical protein OEZ34_10745 [Spirochaetia bacterium]|nr:hypothetical protein [Spirochaetia bacterium]
MKKYHSAYIFFLVFLLGYGAIFGEGTGMFYFKQAYQIEKTDPSSAAALYRKAISEGLHRKIYNAARWRLYYIYKQLDQFENAVVLLSTFGSGKQIENVRKSLVSQIAYYYSISFEAGDQFAEGLLFNQQDPDRAFDFFQKALSNSKNNYKLRNDIVKILMRNGRDRDAKNLFSSVSETPADEMISRADILINSKKLNEAGSILYDLARENNSLTDRQKYRILYLLGKIEKGKRNEYAAIVYFRQASRYDSNSDAEYSMALAAYALYKQGNVDSAYGLLRDYSLSKDSNIELLQLILKIEVEEDSKSLKKLRTKENALKNNNSFLAKQGLILIQKYRNLK